MSEFINKYRHIVTLQEVHVNTIFISLKDTPKFKKDRAFSRFKGRKGEQAGIHFFFVFFGNYNFSREGREETRREDRREEDEKKLQIAKHPYSSLGYLFCFAPAFFLDSSIVCNFFFYKL